ncbi:MAG TPA: S1 family peptidase, partial [Actinoplanes sp.]
MTGVFVRISTRLWGGGLLAAVLVGGLFGSGTATAMAGADEVTGGAYPFVAKVSVGDARACTGALVDARWIVTAKACFADGATTVTAGPPTLPTTVVVGRPDLTAITGHRLAVLSVLPHPDRNLALAELSAPVPDVRPVALGGGAPQVGDRLRVAGYGRTADEWVPNRLHTAAFDVTAVTSTSFEIDGVAEAAAVCKGDAGGPAFREVDGRAELVGINDTSWQKGCLGVTSTRDGAQEARTDDLADWIRAGVAVQPSGLREPVTGEFNRDAHTDLIAADQAGILWLHPGTPTRNVWGPRVRVGAGWAGYRELTVGRFNRDAFDDLVTIESATGKLWLYPGTAAGGAFGARVEIGSGWTDFRDLSVGRLNRDQYDDLLTVQSSTQKLFLYTGTAAGGRLNAAVQVGAGWGCCKQLTVGRFDGDDYDDLVTVNSTGSLLIYRGTAAGNTFAAGVDAGAGAAWNASSYLARGRVDDTGLDGLLAVDAATGQTWLHPRTAAAGWGTRIQPGGRVWAPRPNELSKLVTGEFNRDAHTDLIGVDAAGILWLHRGTPARTFGPRVQIGAGWTGYRDLVVGRFNRDAFDDLVTIESATGKLWLYPGTAAGGAFGAR